MAKQDGIAIGPQPRDLPDIETWRRHTRRSGAKHPEWSDDLYTGEDAVSAENSIDAPEQRRARLKRASSVSSRKHIPSPPRLGRISSRKRGPSAQKPQNRHLDQSPSPPSPPQFRPLYPEFDLHPPTMYPLDSLSRKRTPSPTQSDYDTDAYTGASVRVAHRNGASHRYTKRVLSPTGFDHSSHSPSIQPSTVEKTELKSPSDNRKSSFKAVKPRAQSPSTADDDLDSTVIHRMFTNHRYPGRKSDTEDSRSEASPHLPERLSLPYRPSSLSLSSSTLRPSLSRSSSGVLGDKVYRYSELQEREFRLVKILPARMSTIKCEIFHASLEYPPSYIGISYAWGDAAQTRRIQLDGTIIPIAASLYSALEAVREKKEPVLVWVDALCIDQQHGDERTQQVRLMTSIYTKADFVAIWLGPETDESDLAVKLLEEVAAKANSPAHISSLITSHVARPAFAAIVALFERNYWRRLWVVQEVINARDIMVYCGFTKLPWVVYKEASDVFWRHRGELDAYFHGSSSYGTSRNQYTYSQVLVYQGPSSLLDIGSHRGLGEESFLEVLCACRRKLSTDPRDKVFGILGVLPEEIRSEFPVDYNQSVKEVYINAVDSLLSTTDRLNVICESIHFPLHTSSADLPTWVPDWSHIPETTSLGRICEFSAAGATSAKYNLLDERLKLKVSAIYLDTISAHGIAVGTLCTLADYLMAFLHWRALLLASNNTKEGGSDFDAQVEFCRTLCLDQVPPRWDEPREWLRVCYHVFASLIRDRLPCLPLDRQLRRYSVAESGIKPESRRQFLQEHFGGRMMGRCFCLTNGGCIGMGSGFMAPGDLVVVPLGCSTPILLRLEGGRGEYRFVGDVYIHGYMHGKAIEEWIDRKRDLRKYIIH